MATKLDISELDFDAVKANLKTYLSSHTEFSDYDFEGSGMSVLLDVLAYILIISVIMQICWQMKCFWIVLI